MTTMLKTDSETYPAMLSLDDKSYVLLTNEYKLKIRGSSLKGKQMPIVCDKFRDALCYDVFDDKPILDAFKQFRDLSKFSLHEFQIRVYPSKFDYCKTSLYSKLITKLATQNYRVIVGSSLEYVKTTDGYLPVLLFSKEYVIDYDYYKDRLSELASRILDKPAKALRNLLDDGATQLEEYS